MDTSDPLKRTLTGTSPTSRNFPLGITVRCCSSWTKSSLQRSIRWVKPILQPEILHARQIHVAALLPWPRQLHADALQSRLQRYYMTTASGPTPGIPPHTAFTCRYQGRSSTLTSEVEIFVAFTPPEQRQGKKYKALYDTGATHSAFSEGGCGSAIGLNRGNKCGCWRRNAYYHQPLVNIGLPNRVMFGMMRVAKMTLRPDIDALIGMDILGQGDFAVQIMRAKQPSRFVARPGERSTSWLRS